MNSGTAGTVQAANYVQQLFPKTGSTEANAAAAAYSSVGAPINQVIGIMGECMVSFMMPFHIVTFLVLAIFICPTYFLLQAFQGRSWKVNIPSSILFEGDT